MTPTQYDVTLAYYECILKAQVEEDVPTHEPPEVTNDADDSAQVPMAESTPAAEEATGPFDTSLSAPDPDGERNATAEGLLAAKAKLRAEAIGWGVRADEADYIIGHHPLPAARNLLWKT